MIPKTVIDNIAEYLQRLFKMRQETASVSGKDDNSLYLSLAEDDDEREDIKDLCEDIDNYYEERARLKASKMKAYHYFEKRAVEMYKEENPNATDEECAQYLDDIRNTMDKVITTNAEVFSREADDNGIDDYGQAESFLTMAEDKLRRNEEIDLPEPTGEDKGKEARDEQKK